MMLNRRVFASIAVAATFIASTVAAAPTVAAAQRTAPLPDTVAVARSAAADVMKATGATSMSLALVDGKRVVWSTTLGVIDAAGTKPDSSTLYGIGSVSKMLATIAVMQLVDAGKVSLDAPVTDYITDFRMASPEYRQITVRMLLDHSAGLPGTDYANAFTSTPYTGYAEQVLDTLATQRLKSTPGAMSVYCNDCFTLAGLVAERVSGESYPDYVTRHILRPLGMDLSRYSTTAPAQGSYAPVLADGKTLPIELTSIYASGGLMSTPREMSRLAMMLMNGGTVDGVRILSKKAVSEMARSQLPTTMTGGRTPFRYGLGWDSVAEPGLEAVGIDGWVKGGDTVQYHAAFTLAPEEDLAMSVLAAGTTADSGTLETLAQRILLTALAEKGVIDEAPEPSAAKEPRAAAPTAQQSAAMAGIYLAQGGAFRITPRRNGALDLAVYRDGQWVSDHKPFTLRSDGRYWATSGTGTSLGLTRGWGRTFLSLSKPGGVGHYREDFALGQKVTSVGSLSAAWRARTEGTWLLVNERVDSALWQGMPDLTLAEIDGLAGYLWVTDALNPAPVDPSVSDELAVMFVNVPIMQGRDLNDLVVLARADGEWLRFGGSLYRPLASVPALAKGDIVIASDGYAEWRRAATEQTVRITGDGAWKAYGADGTPVGAGPADGSAVTLPAGTLLVLFGGAGTRLAVSGAA